MKVVLTAPMPGSKTPSFPLAGAILDGFSMQLLCCAIAARSIDEDEIRTRIAATEARCAPEQTNNDEGRAQDLQIAGINHSISLLKRCRAPQNRLPGPVDIQDNCARKPILRGAASLQERN